MAARIVYGVGPVTELLARRSRDIQVLYVDEKRLKKQRDPVRELVKRGRGSGVGVEPCPRDRIDALAGSQQHQGVLALVGEYQYTDLDDALAACSGQPALFVALDNVQDPRNLGAIIRSAHLFGAHGIIIPRDNAAQVTAAATKTSAGATEHIPVCQVTNLARALDALKHADLWLAAVAVGPETQPIHEIDARTPLCLVLGAEGRGLRRVIADVCDFRVEIPMASAGVGSFNVAVAAGIALYEVARQRRT